MFSSGDHAGAAQSAASAVCQPCLRLHLPLATRSIARGMVHLHSRRPAIFHRDLKPGNVFLGVFHEGCVELEGHAEHAL